MALTINGTNGIETNTDTGKLKVGADDDLQISHNGSHSYIDATGTGDLYLRGGPNIRLTDLSDNKMILCQDGGETQLYHNGAQKLNTISTGVNVTGNIKVDSGSGIDFSATSNSSEATNTGFSEVLDDYEEGECTMGFKFSNQDFNGSYAERAGKYTRIGNMVHLDFHMNLSSMGTNTSGYVKIRGLPFTAINNMHFRASGSIGYFSNADSGVGSMFVFLDHNSTEFEPRIPGSGTVTSMASGDISSSLNLYGSVTYFTS